MSLGQCPKCWDEPCTCGEGYRHWSQEQRTRMARTLLQSDLPRGSTGDGPVPQPEKQTVERVVVGHQYPGEGYAVVRCGSLEVQVGYTLLHAIRQGYRVDGSAARFSELCDFGRALDHLCQEASQGKKGDTGQ
jgi:hypothetical protein